VGPIKAAATRVAATTVKTTTAATKGVGIKAGATVATRAVIIAEVTAGDGKTTEAIGSARGATINAFAIASTGKRKRATRWDLDLARLMQFLNDGHCSLGLGASSRRGLFRAIRPEPFLDR
jgi:hypothetical protein